MFLCVCVYVYCVVCVCMRVCVIVSKLITPDMLTHDTRKKHTPHALIVPACGPSQGVRRSACEQAKEKEDGGPAAGGEGSAGFLFVYFLFLFLCVCVFFLWLFCGFVD